ncbi:MAG: DMT family transporter [Betaproteobacteria bacterium]|nr:MAG: DMT family transporter [Betaproteobacteria bacterium]
MTPAANRLKGLAWILLSILCWAPMFPIAKRALPYVDAFGLGTLRYLVGSVLFVALLWAIEGRQALRYDGRMVPAAVFGMIGITGFNVLVWVGLGFTRPEHAAIIMALQSPLIALTLWLTRGQRPAPFVIGCVAAALAGVFLVVTQGDPAAVLAQGVVWGDALIFLGAVSWVVYTLAAGRFAGWSPLRLTVLTCIPGAVGLFVANGIAIALGIATLPSSAAIAAIGWQLAYFSTCTVVLGVLGFNFGVKYLGPLNTLLMLNLVPVSVFAIEAWLGRDFAPIELAGAAIVIGALIANNLHQRRISARA